VTNRALLLDTNLLVLFVVGNASREFVAKHKRTTNFAAEDFDLLTEMANQVNSLIVLPNTLAETSNLLAHAGNERMKEQVFDVFRRLIPKLFEIFVPSTDACSIKEFQRLGLTDAAILHCLREGGRHLLTADLPLWHAATSLGFSATNFNHLRNY